MMHSHSVYVEVSGHRAVFHVSQNDVDTMLRAAKTRLHDTRMGRVALRALGTYDARLAQAQRMVALCEELSRIFPTIQHDPEARARNERAAKAFLAR